MAAVRRPTAEVLNSALEAPGNAYAAAWRPLVKKHMLELTEVRLRGLKVVAEAAPADLSRCLPPPAPVSGVSHFPRCAAAPCSPCPSCASAAASTRTPTAGEARHAVADTVMAALLCTRLRLHACEARVTPPTHLLPLATPLCSSVELLVAEGTVPMHYRGAKYNIPVQVWLPERYPLAAPIAWVVPTPDMMIKPRHSFVDGSGAGSRLAPAPLCLRLFLNSQQRL